VVRRRGWGVDVQFGLQLDLAALLRLWSPGMALALAHTLEEAASIAPSTLFSILAQTQH
jgi:hypothetical protein